MDDYILKISNLELYLGKNKVIKDLSLKIKKGEILAVLGSSGSGKSLLAQSILGILPNNTRLYGDMYYKGNIINDREKMELRGHSIVYIPQSVNYLDPLLKIKKQIKISIKYKEDKRIYDVFKSYSLPLEVLEKYPFELSGGMIRRVFLAIGSLSEGELIIADEPTPGLDENRLNEVYDNFKKLSNSGVSILMITHDIKTALKIADKIAVLYAGSIVEIADKDDFDNMGENLRHPYSKALINAAPFNAFKGLEGSQPTPNEIVDGCDFCDRCFQSGKECKLDKPTEIDLRGGKVRCFNAT